VSNDHQQVIKSRPCTPRAKTTTPAPSHRDDPFARLVAQVAADPDNPFNIEKYLWVLEEPPPRQCPICGDWFDPWFDYVGEAPHGPARRYCSRRCAGRAAYERHRGRLGRSCAAPYWKLAGSRCSCKVCGAEFDPAVGYEGQPIRAGRRRTCCSRLCQARLGSLRTGGARAVEMRRAA
jgi:rubredoxin